MINNIVVVGIAGEAGCGKDTLTNLIQKNYSGEGSAMSLRFSGPLYNILKCLTGIEYQQAQQREIKETYNKLLGMSIREFLQKLGTEFFRTYCDESFFIRLLEKNIIDSHGIFNIELVIVPDVRFENEAEWVRQHGLLVHLTRPDNPYKINSTHRSEQQLEKQKGDLSINASTLKELKEGAELIEAIAHELFDV